MHHTMVPSDSVEHVTVYGRDGTKLGTIERLPHRPSEFDGDFDAFGLMAIAYE